MGKTIKLSPSELNQIYRQLQPVAAQVLADGQCTEQNRKAIRSSGLDRFLTPQDVAKWSGSTPGFTINRIWYGRYEDLKAVYDRAVALDSADGKFDGKISSTSQDQIEISLPDDANINWTALTQPYLKSIFPIERNVEEQKGNGEGTTWIIEREQLPSGLYRYWCITNAHIADHLRFGERAYKIKATVQGVPVIFEAKLHGVDHSFDVAVFSFESSMQFAELPVAQESKIEVGDHIAVVGNQLGKGIVTTEGTINATSKYSVWPMRLIQDDSSALKGNSGSPVFRSDGKVIAICNSGDENGENYNIPIEYVWNSYRQIRSQGQAVHGALKINWSLIDEDKLRVLGIPNYSNGFYVTDVIGSQAKKAGLQPGDIIVSYDGQPIPSDKEAFKLDAYFALKKPGEKVQLILIREGRVLEFSIIVEAYVNDQRPTYRTEFGFFVQEPDSHQREEYGFSPVEAGLLLFECQDSGGKEECYFAGMLHQVNTTPISTIEGLKKFLRASNDSWFVFHYTQITRTRRLRYLLSHPNRNKL